MSEELENQNQEEHKENCGCDDCKCSEEFVEYECGCSATEKLFVVSAVANIITAVIVTALAGTIFFNMYQANKVNNPNKQARVQNEKPSENGIFSKKSMSLKDAMKDSKTAIVLFYADWCPHCRNFAPTFKDMEKDRKLKKKYNFVRINSEDPTAQQTMQEYEIQGFPSLFMVNPKTGEKQQVENYLMFGDDAKETLKGIFEEFDAK